MELACRSAQGRSSMTRNECLKMTQTFAFLRSYPSVRISGPFGEGHRLGQLLASGLAFDVIGLAHAQEWTLNESHA